MGNNLTKRDIVLEICDKLDEAKSPSGESFRSGVLTQRDIKDTVQYALETIADALADGRNIELRNFGVFQLQVRKSRVGRNPNRPEKDVMIPRRAVIKFKAGKELKERLASIDLDQVEKETEE